MILDKVLSDERSTAYVTTIDDINDNWLDCKECDWFKSKETILSEASLSILNVNMLGFTPRSNNTMCMIYQ